MKILVTGATSLIGKEVIKILINEGYEIRSLTRQKNIQPDLLKSEIWVYDLAEVPAIIAEGVDVVIHIAAATPGAKSSTASYFKTNVEGTRHLVEICKEQNISRFIFISSIAAMDKENKGAYALSKKEAESIIINSNLNWTILRPSEIFGADKSWTSFLHLLKNKKFVFVPGDGKQLRHPVFSGDVVNAIIQVINNKNTVGKKYVLASKKPIGYFQLLTLIRKIFNCHFKILVFPYWLIKILTLVKPILPGKLKRKTDNAHRMLKNTELDIQDAVTDFGFNPVEIEKGLRDLKDSF